MGSGFHAVARVDVSPANSKCGRVGHSEDLVGGFSGYFRPGKSKPGYEVPLVIALHGGSYDSSYFDVSGYSLLERMELAQIPILAPDRPGYGSTSMLPPPDRTIRGQARILTNWMELAWARYGATTQGVVLIGHSIGGAIALAVAAEALNFPLVGLAISGVGLRTPPHFQGIWSSLPDTEKVVLPAEIKDEVMFGPRGSFDSSMPSASHPANAPAPRVEIIDIVTTWHEDVREILAKITVPVHYRQAKVDRLWIVDAAEVKGFADAFARSPRVDASMISATGHCMDFHRIGAAFHFQQIGFALQCACQAAST